MNENIEERLFAYLDAIESKAEVAGDFVLEQTPLLAQEYLAWYWWSSLVGSSVGLFLVAVAIAGMLLGIVKECRAGGTMTWGFPVGCLSLILFVISIFPAVICTGDFIKVTVAPRVVLLEKVSTMLPKP